MSLQLPRRKRIMSRLFTLKGVNLFATQPLFLRGLGQRPSPSVAGAFRVGHYEYLHTMEIVVSHKRGKRVW